MKKAITTILFSTLLAIGIFANNIHDPFWQQSFNASLPITWSVGDESGQNVLWQRCDNPYKCLPAGLTNVSCKDRDFRSSGFYDGYMFVNSYENGILPTPSKSYLRSELIDCTDKSAVFIQFQTYIHAGSTNPSTNAVLRVRSGNGPWTTFTIFPYLNSNDVDVLQSWNAQPVLLDISAAAANKTDVTIEWNWTANYDVTWMIDDVALFDVDPKLDNVIWGQTQGTFAGGLNGWTVTQQLDTCRWRWISNGLFYLPVGGAKADYYACWPGAENGAMLMNASNCNFHDPSTPYSLSSLLSPTINLSSVPTGTKLDLKFDQAFALGNQAIPNFPITSIAVSINNGSTYIDTLELNNLQPFWQGKCEEMSLRLPIAVAGKPQVRLKFVFSGDTHFWMIDNVRIAYANDQDMAINSAFYNVSPDFSQPKNQLRPITLFAQIKNIGNLNMDDVVVVAEVRNIQNDIVFSDSLSLGQVEPGDDWIDIFFPNKFLPIAEIDTFRIYYRIQSSTQDQNPANNLLNWEYRVTEGVYSKNEFCPTSNSYFFPSESVKYEIGNCYYISNGSGLKAKSVSFAYSKNQKLDEANAVISINLYKWRKENNIGDVNNDTIANNNEFELVAYNTYDADSDDKDKVVTIPISGEMDSIDLEDNTYYFVTIGYLDPVADNGNGAILRFPIAGSEEINYTATFYNSYEDGIPAYTSMLREGDDTDFRANAWALRRIPFINMNVVPYVSDTKTVYDSASNIKVLPNPASQTINLSCDFVNYKQSIQVEIFDLCGRLVLSREFQNGFVSQMPIDVSGLSNGSYTLRVVSGTSVASSKIMVFH
ncbi:MAG: T9SS type A sorting domain-containing protein [Bacteroidetes bacterium]|nr:T9SS type A sorting domain-containing protein [Bacteroidota bacterium]